MVASAQPTPLGILAIEDAPALNPVPPLIFVTSFELVEALTTFCQLVTALQLCGVASAFAVGVEVEVAVNVAVLVGVLVGVLVKARVAGGIAPGV